MSADDGSRTGAPDVENSLVTAFGFEPTAGLVDDASDVLVDDGIVDDGSGDALDWSEREGTADLEGDGSSSPGDDAGALDANSTAKVGDSTMTPPKGKGKGPRTFKSSASDGQATAKNGSSLPSGNGDETAPVDIDPAELMDADSSGVKPGLFDKRSDEDPTFGDDPLETDFADASPSLDSVDETGPIPAGSYDETGPQAVATVLAGDQTPTGPTVTAGAIVDEAKPIDYDVAPTSPPAAETIVTDATVGAPPPPVAEATPVMDPPPPLVGDPVPAVGGDVAVGTGALVSARQVGGGVKKGGLASSLPDLLDQGFLKRTRRVRARKVRRVVRHIDPWSVLTFSVLFFLCLFAALLLASVLVWNAAVAAGTIENMESFIREIGDYQTYEIKGDVVFRAAMVIAGILTLAASVMMVLLVVVFNLISDLVGGIRLTVVEEETVRVRRRNQ